MGSLEKDLKVGSQKKDYGGNHSKGNFGGVIMERIARSIAVIVGFTFMASVSFDAHAANDLKQGTGVQATYQVNVGKGLEDKISKTSAGCEWKRTDWGIFL